MTDLPLTVRRVGPPFVVPDWWYIEAGLTPPPPEPTPLERALQILAPHLAEEPLYQP